MNILITGGTGFIGSHTAVDLLQASHSLILLDNLCNSHREVATRIADITGKVPLFVEGDIRDRELLNQIFSRHTIDAVIHLAGLKSVAESAVAPKAYYDSNLSGSITLVNAVLKAGVELFVFSSSATVYGVPRAVPVTEDTPLGRPSNPYGMTKLFIEEMLRDVQQANPSLSIAILRYFNPVGAHPSGLIGEQPVGTPNNLVPYICDVALGRRPDLKVFGADYPTIDGTGVRDYIHVLDLAEGHRRALDFLEANGGLHTWNLGTGTGFSVFQVISAFEQVCKVRIPYTVIDRRKGDIPEVWAGIDKIGAELNWTANRGLPEMLRDSWRWALANAAHKD